jgi:hypothetical protein
MKHMDLEITLKKEELRRYLRYLVEIWENDLSGRMNNL